jgi:hypothetical protein
VDSRLVWDFKEVADVGALMSFTAIQQQLSREAATEHVTFCAMPLVCNDETRKRS